MASSEWWRSHTMLVEVASFGVESGDLATPEAVVYFFEKPWKYDELHAAWAVLSEEIVTHG